MDLNMDLIADSLRQEYKIAGEDAYDENLTFEQARLFTGNTEFLPGIVYIAEGGKLPAKPFFEGRCGIVSIGLSHKRYRASDCDVIEVEKGADISGVLNCVQETFTKYGKWYLDMYEALLNEDGVQRLLELSLPLLENPVYFHDRNYRFVSYAEIPGMPGGSDVFDIQKNKGVMSLDMITEIKNTPYFEKTFETTKPTFHVDEGDLSYIYDNVWVGEKYWGRLFVDERVRPFKKSDYAVVGILCKMVVKALTSRKISPGTRYRFLEQKLVSLLEGRAVETGELSGELKLNGWEAGDEWLCFQIQLSEVDLLLNTIIGMCELVESKLHDCVTFPYEDRIVGVARVDGGPETLERIREAMGDFRLYAGVSLGFGDFKDFPLYYKQAGIALRCGVKENENRNENEWVHYFQDYCFSYMLDRLDGELRPEMLYPPALHKLIEFDRKKSTNYVETLRAYLESDLKPAKAMKRLYIQRSTFIYRLDRIGEITGADFEDAKVKTHFLIAFRLMDRAGG